VCARGGDPHADHDADGGHGARGCQHLPDVGESRGQAAFDEDHGQRCRADVAGQFDVVELQSQTVLAEHDPDQEEQEQAGEPDPRCHPGADDAGKQHEAADQQGQIQLLQGHCRQYFRSGDRPDPPGWARMAV
jgi:hypothetical protein